MKDMTTQPMADALRVLRDTSGMSNTDLCARAGVCPATISRYLSGSRCSTAIDDRGARTIEKLAAAFGVEPDFFIEYRVWRACQISRRHPHLIDQVYRILVEAAALEVLLDEGSDQREQ